MNDTTAGFILIAGLLDVTVTFPPNKDIILTSGKELNRTFETIEDASEFLLLYKGIS